MPHSPLPMLVIGTSGQLSTALAEGTEAHGMRVQCLGFPELDLGASPEAITHQVAEAARAMQARVIVNAAAYTAVDKAEDEPAVAEAVNGAAPGAIARAAAMLTIPVIQISTDYVFDGTHDGWWQEDDATGPLGVYGRTKLNGERAVSGATPDHAILRTAWVYAPYGANFVRTMLRLAAEGRSELGVVGDQIGCPTSVLDIADAVFKVARNLVERPDQAELRGVFHLVGKGEASWAEFAEAIFTGARERGAPAALVKSITTADYPTRAQRPANSRLDSGKIARLHGVEMPAWKTSLNIVLDRLLTR